MKKFLFTLASLFIASSAFANSYFFMEKPEITEDMVGDIIELTVGADFQEYVSAFELWITMPEGLEILDFEAGADMKGLKYYSRIGREQSLDASVTTLDMQHFVGITSAAATGYYQPEGSTTWEPYGAVKWEPGVYENMIILYVEVSAVPTEDVMLYTEPGCGADPRTDNLATPANGNNIPWGVVPGDTPEPQPAPAPTFREADGKLYAECADHEVVLMLGGEVVENPYTLPAATFEEQVLNFTAYTVANADESENSDPVEYTVTIAAKEDAKAPAPTFRVEDGKLYAESAEGLDVVMMLDGEPCANPYILPTENTSYTQDIVLNFTAYAKADGENYNINSDNAEYTFTLPHLTKTEVESPSIMRNIISDTQAEIIITPDPATDGELQYTADPMPGAKATTLTYERKDADYTVHVEAWTTEGPTCQASEKEIADIVIPAKPAPEQTKTPSVTYNYEDGNLTVWAYGSDDDAVYTLYCDGVEYTGEMPIVVDPYEGYNHTWTATAIAPGKTVSAESDPCEIVIEAEPKVYTTPDPVIGEPVVNDENVTVVVTGEGHIVVTVTMGTETLNFEGDGTVNVVIPRGEEDDFAIINAVATAPLPEGYDEVQPGRATSDLIDIPALPEQTAAPTITNKDGKSEWDTEGNLTYDGHYTTVTITNNDEEDVVIYWSYDGVTYQPYTGPWNITEDGDYVIYAYAQAEGRPASEVVSWAVHVTPATGVVELVNGKAVAGVRYFNMAGQEMKEANGVTIVVTTYTDGTTSAVKVIK